MKSIICNFWEQNTASEILIYKVLLTNFEMIIWCNGITSLLATAQNYICPRCKGDSQPIDGRPMTQADVEGTKLDVEDTFCYLGEMLCSGGGCDSAIAARCCVACGKFRKLFPVLTSRHLSPKVRGKIL